MVNPKYVTAFVGIIAIILGIYGLYKGRNEANFTIAAVILVVFILAFFYILTRKQDDYP